MTSELSNPYRVDDFAGIMPSDDLGDGAQVNVRKKQASGALALALAVCMSSCGFEPENTQHSASAEIAFSRLDDAGREEIKKSGHARLDLRSVPMDANKHGLVDLDSLGPLISAETGEEIRVDLVAPGGEFEVGASSLSFFVAEAPEGILSVDIVRPFDSLDAACQDMVGNAQWFGWSETEITGWCVSSPEEAGANSTLVAGIGEIGLPASVTARTGDNSTVLQYTIHTDPDLLTPSEREKIRSYPGTSVDEPAIPELATPEGESEWENHPRSASHETS